MNAVEVAITMSYIPLILLLLLFTAVVVGFDMRLYTVGEQDGPVELCVNVTMPRRQDIGTVTFSLTVETQDGSAGIVNRRSIYYMSLIG